MINTENTEGMKSLQSCEQSVSPSELAKWDVSKYIFYSDLYDHPSHNFPETLTIDHSPMLQRRAPFIRRELHFGACLKGNHASPKMENELNPLCRPAFERQKVTSGSR